MKLLILFVVSLVLVVKGWKQKYGNDFVTYSIGERFERGENVAFVLIAFSLELK